MFHRLFCSSRFVGSSVMRDETCKSIRKTFIDYFVNLHEHSLIRSSPVVPYCDPSVAFVNAGMNQFKGVFLDQNLPPCLRAVNSQKCIRIGGKHNDLDAVGADGYHHTFFEMLGNWSFGDYFKKEACEMAWALLTGPYGLAPERLYVTYFGGDKIMRLEPDLETRDIWRNIGVPADHVLPFGAGDNFWEMGSMGPCGPCTEIHFDHVVGRNFAANRVNMGDSDLTEIWNLVFIQYYRSADGTLTQLPRQHVDTGMGLERLVAVIQGKQSNYDTDVFQPLFLAIQKGSGAPAYRGMFGVEDVSGLDTGYRILADHARMVTVALADGMFPEHNHKLRRILRRALTVCQKTFGVDQGLLKELTNHVADLLAEAYPEIGTRLNQVQVLVAHEEELLRALRLGASGSWKKIIGLRPELGSLDIVEMPGLVAGYLELEKSLSSLKNRDNRGSSLNGGLMCSLPGDLTFKLYDTFGLDETVIKQLADALGFRMDPDSLKRRLEDTRSRTKLDSGSEGEAANVAEQLALCGICPTDDSLKYRYSRGHFPSLEARVTALVVRGECVGYAEAGAECGVVLDRSNFYHEAGGQAGDRGCITLADGTTCIVVTDVDSSKGYLIHRGIVQGGRICVGNTANLQIDDCRRLAHMRNHTATHLVNAALHRALTVTCQRSSRVTDTHLAFEFSVCSGDSLGPKEVATLEEDVRAVVSQDWPVKRRSLSANQLLALDHVTLVPGEVYPEQDIHIIEIETQTLLSREACCGTHVLNTQDIGDFCVVGFKATGSASRTLKALTGPEARDYHVAGQLLLERVSRLSETVNSFLGAAAGDSRQAEILGAEVLGLRQELLSGDGPVPYCVRSKCLDTLQGIGKQLKEGVRGSLRESLEVEMSNVLLNLQDDDSVEGQSFLVHFLRCSSTMDSVPLQKATKLCPDIPVLLLARSEGLIKARCCVPERMVSNHFNAELWMTQVIPIFKSQGFVPRGQDPQLVFNMKGRKISEEDVDRLIPTAIDSANKFAHQVFAIQGKVEQC